MALSGKVLGTVISAAVGQAVSKEGGGFLAGLVPGRPVDTILEN